MDLSEEQEGKEVLIENFGQHLETEDHLPPLAARMLAHLIIDNHKGFTFDELVEVLKASKSSVCTNLNILIHKRRVSYYTLAGDRKRYFRVSPDDMLDRMDEKMRSCDQVLSICRQIIDYKQANTCSGQEAAVLKQLKYLESIIRFTEQFKALCGEYKENIVNLNK